MPTYDYKCSHCGHTFEEFHSMKDASLTLCPSCGNETLVRLIGGGSGMIFKGSGFYLTDYKGNSSGKDSSGSVSSSSPPAPSKESKPASNPGTTAPSSPKE